MKYYILPLCLLMLFSCSKGGGAKDFKISGLDVSRHQGNIDWDKVLEHEEPHFVFLKATEGTLIKDPTYMKHSRELDDAGVLWGAYHFFGHRTPGKEQAKNFIKTANLKKGNLRPVLDIEKHRFMTDPKKMVKEAKAFCREIRRHYGKNPIIYCSAHFYDAYLKNDFKDNDYPLWIAHYREESPDCSWTIWQHTETYRIKGIRGHVDRNVFSGDSSALRKLVLQ